MLSERQVDLVGWVQDWKTANSLPVYHDLVNGGYYVGCGFINMRNAAAIQGVKEAGPFETLDKVYEWRKGVG